MCLYVKERTCIQTAKSDIVVYKHLKNVYGQYLTTYQLSKVSIGNTYESDLVKDFNTVDLGIHSFASKIACNSDGRCENAHVIVKCIIPKGSKYYVGEFCENKSYASNKLTYVEVIKNL